MPTPMRVTAGFTQDNPNQPLAFMGAPDPFFLHQFSSDFDIVPSGTWTLSGAATPTFTSVAGDGGIGQLATTTTTPTAAQLASAQVGSGSFSYTASKRMFFFTRIATNLASTNVIRAGLAAVTADPFTTAPDGIYFVKATAGLSFSLQVVVSGVVTGTVAVPASAFTFANNGYVDLGFEVTPNANIKVFAGTNLVGYRPQSGTGTQTTPPPAGGPNARLTPTSFPSALMAPTLAVQTQTAAQATLNVDMVLAAKER